MTSSLGSFSNLSILKLFEWEGAENGGVPTFRQRLTRGQNREGIPRGLEGGVMRWDS